MITLGENLKRLRQREGITQEQLAEALELTPQAVSRWENSISLPDITLLPVLANYFNVTTDELLGVDIESRQAKITEIMEHNSRLNHEGKVDDSIAYLREKVRLFPNSAELLYQLIVVLYKKSCNKDFKSEQLFEVITLCNRAMRLDGGSTWVTECCKQWLCFSYSRLGQHEKAVEIAGGMSTAWISKEILLPKVQHPDEERVQRQRNLLTFMDILIINLHHLARLRNAPEERIEILQKAVQLVALLMGDDPKFYNERLYKCYLWIARNYCELGNAAKAIDSLNSALQHAAMYEARPNRSSYDVYWLSDIEDSREVVWRDGEEDLFRDMLNSISGEDFSTLHDTTAYAEICSKIADHI